MDPLCLVHAVTHILEGTGALCTLSNLTYKPRLWGQPYGWVLDSGFATAQLQASASPFLSCREGTVSTLMSWGHRRVQGGGLWKRPCLPLTGA